MALADLGDYVTRDEYSMFVIDTAPTGHLLRLLETPDLARQWLGFMLELFVKRGVALRMRQTSQMIMGLSRRLREIKKVFTSPKLCHPIIITTPEKVVLAEAARLLDSLGKMGIVPRTVILNMVLHNNLSTVVKCARETVPKLFQSNEVVVVPRYSHELLKPKVLATLFRLK
jgi:arsenite-transporting ATPase